MSIKIDTRLFLTFLFFMTLFFQLEAQRWLRTYPHEDMGWTSYSAGHSVQATQDGGYIIAGDLGYASGAVRDYIRLIKTDQDGEVQWDRVYNHGEITAQTCHSVLALDDGTYVVGGSEAVSGRKAFLLKVNALGDTVWVRSYGLDTAFTASYDVQLTEDGGFILAGITDKDGDNTFGPYFVKTDAEGNVQWEKDYEAEGFEGFILAIQPVSTGGYIAVGSQGTPSLLMRLDEQGDTLWTRTNINSVGDFARSVIETADGGFLIGGDLTGFAGYSPTVFKTDSEGNEEWSGFPYSGLGSATSLLQNADGTYIVTGSLVGSTYPPFEWPTNADGFMSKLDTNGEVLWSRPVGAISYPNQSSAAEVIAAPQGGYVVTGGLANEPFLLKTDENGLQIANFITGKVAMDEQENCEVDTSDIGLASWIIEVEGVGILPDAYTLTDDNGNYAVLVDTGTYVVKVVPPNAYWLPCEAEIEVHLDSPEDTTTVNFPVIPEVECPYLTVDVSTPILRRCFDNYYSVSYCNDGITPAEDAFVEITLDTFLNLLDASIPYTQPADHLYQFPVGTVQAGQCGYFYFTANLSCEGTVLGQTHCVEAHIYPDSLCLPETNASPIIEVTGSCIGDSVRFELENVGDLDMDEPAYYIVIEDDVMYLHEPFELGEGETADYIMAANGATFRLETERFPGNMDGVFVSSTIEGCGTASGGTISTGFFNLFPLNDNSPFIDLECRASVGSYDPNDKQAFPQGYRESHYIKANTDIDYHIRFQNTGTDTAFHVVIRDTLSSHLDPATISPGSSSHPYEFKLYEDGILQFTFNEIELPDSNINEPASHGFVKFKVAQQPDLPLETRIENRAAIYFDFNEPVITNTTFHTIGEDFLEVVDLDVEPTYPAGKIEVMPNPFEQQTQIRISGTEVREGLLQVFTAQGVLVRTDAFRQNEFTFAASTLPKGIYFFRVLVDGKGFGSGRLVVQ